MRLTEYTRRYLLSRDVTAAYAKLLLGRITRFVVWCGRDLMVTDLDADLVNGFLVELQQAAMSRVTVDNYRRAILCVWRAAYFDRLNDHPPLRVRPIRKPRPVVTAFTLDEIRRLVEVAGRLSGFFPNGARRADVWLALIHSAYSTGLRRGDLLAVRKAEIRVDGLAKVVQSKTGELVVVRYSPEALAAIRRTPVELERACPWPYHENALPRQFRALVKLAGVRPGQFKWLRRSAGSYAESQRPGDGSALLGHRSPQVFRTHYEDLLITRAVPIEPPPLGNA